MRQSNLLVQLLLTATLLFLGQGLKAQTTLYSEDFESTAVGEGLTGALTGNQSFNSTNGKWNLLLAPSGLTATTDWVRVEDGVSSFSGFPGAGFTGGSRFLQFRDIDEEVRFRTQSIDISSYNLASISVDVFENGLFEASTDYFEVAVIVDGVRSVVQRIDDDFSDANSPVGSSSSSDPGNTTPGVVSISTSGITGSSLIIEILAVNNSGSEYYNLDKVEVTGTGFVAPNCTFAFGANSATCDAITPGVDTYTATFNFSGAGNGNYTVTSNAGTVVLDNDPDAVASGSFRVIGVPEGTDVTATVNGVNCTNLISTVTAPNCMPAPSVVINEIMYNPPESGTDTSEYVEIFNNSGFAVDLSGWNFTQGITYTFPGGTLLADQEYYVIAVNGTAFQNKYGFAADGVFSGGLSNGGEDIELVDAVGTVQDYVDYDNGGAWPSTPDGNGPSLELLAPASDNSLPASWAASIDPNGTPGTLNQTGCSLQLTVASVTCDTETVGPNSDTYTVEVNWSGGGPQIGVIQFLTFPVSGVTGTGNGGDPSVDATGTYTYFNVPEGTAFESTWITSGGCDVTVSAPAPTCEPAAPLAELVITEIMYNPKEAGNDTTEFVEIYNNGSSVIDLSGFSFANGFVFTFPAGSQIAAGEYQVIAGNATGFENFYGCAPDYEWTSGALSNGGELVLIENASATEVDRVQYDDNGSWPSAPDGDGPSLELIDANSDNTLASSWEASEGFGTPGAPNTGMIGDCAPVAPVASINGSIMYFPEISWTDQNFAASYEIQRQIAGGGFAPVATVAGDVTTFTDTLLVFGLAVEYKVVAENVNGTATSNTVSVTQPANIERLVLEYSCYDAANEELVWTVENPNPVALPFIYAQWWSNQRDTLIAPANSTVDFRTQNNLQSPATLGDDNITGIWWIDETLQAGEPNDLVLTADLSANCAAARRSNPAPQAEAWMINNSQISALFTTTDLTELTLAGEIKVGPNPFTNTLFVETAELTGTSTVALYDMVGRKVFETEIHLGSRTEIAVPSNLKKGMYLMQLGSAKGSFTKKVMKK